MRAIRLCLASMIPSVSVLYLTAQGVNHIQISPSEPTPTDTIYVISDFSYYGACAYGLVYSFINTTDTSVLITPTYCGYFDADSILCQSIDTFKIDPLLAGTYHLNITYHQGSVCPVSGFDAIIATYDTSITISGTNNILQPGWCESPVIVYPSPADDRVTIEIEDYREFAHHQLVILNALGQVVFHNEINTGVMHLNTATWHGIHFMYLLSEDGYITDLHTLAIR